ncbi:hypothetical protein ACFQLX_00610 [Streptomyces polyrhachis]|uniref:Integral membrane protein n=1 Tax=Streptomyces polyrhachis TaxID=1282885 RepID=A0ABW2G9L8_9ACTN
MAGRVAMGIRMRGVRAALFTALCVTLSAGAHVLLAAAPLPAATLAWVTAAVFALAFALAGTPADGGRRGFLRIAALLVPLELAADTVFTTGRHACYGPSGGPVGGTLRSLGVDLLCGGGELGTPLARMTARGDSLLTGTASPWLLLAAHLAAGLAGAAWLAHGETAAARLLRAAGAAAFRPLLLAFAVCRAAIAEPARLPVRPRWGAVAAHAREALTHSLARRGPPLPAAAR